MVLGRPGTVSNMGLAVHSTATSDFFPLGLPPLPEGLKGLDDLFVVGLIIGYEYRFHFAAFLSLRRSLRSIIPE